MLLRRLNSLVIKRPLSYALAGFLLAYFLCGFLQNPIKLTFAIILFYFSLALAGVNIIFKLSGSAKRIHSLAYIMLLLAIALAFLLSFLNFDVSFDRLKRKYDNIEANVNLTVISSDSVNEGFSSHKVLISEINGEKCRIKASMVSTYLNPFEEGESLSLPVKISVSTNFSKLSEASRLARGYTLTLLSENEEALEISDDSKVFPYAQTARLRQGVSRTVRALTRDEGTSLSTALIYGDRSELSHSFTDSFKELGLSHMLAISGMHFSITVGLLATMLYKASLDKRLAVVFLVLFVLFYALISGFSASVSRAAIMLLISYASFYFGKRSDAITSLFCAAFIICIISPYAIYDIGLILSFLSTLGILTVALPVNEGLRGKGICKISVIYSLISSVNITLSAVLFTLPISYFCFGYVSYVSPITNLIFSVFITLILYLLPFLLIFSPVTPIARLIGGAVTLLSKITCRLAESLADLGDFTVSFDSRLSAILFSLTLISIAAMILFYRNLSQKRAFLYIPLTVFILLCYIGNTVASYPYLHQNSLAYYTEDENDAIVISSGGDLLLCDNSGGSYSFTQNALKYGEKTCKGTFTAYMISDYHYTHIATVTRLLEYTDIRTFILPVPEERDVNFHSSIVTFLTLSGCEVIEYVPNEENLKFGSISITPYIHSHETANPASILLIEDSEKSFPTYAYFSNTKALTLNSRDFLDTFTETVGKADAVICGSHGDSKKAFDTIAEIRNIKIVRSSFYTGIKK